MDGGNGSDFLNGGSGNDIVSGGLGYDTLTGGAGDDTINGYASSIYTNTQVDWLSGGAGSDTFVLGEAGTVFYSKPNDGYAVIRDWDPRSGDFDVERDRVQLTGNASQYKLQFASVNGVGNSTQDTEILFNSNNSWEQIGVIQDSVNFNLSRDAVFV